MIMRASGRSEPANGGSFFEEIGCRKRDRPSGTRGEVFDTLERRFIDKAEGG
jgi:hypothetical protein